MKKVLIGSGIVFAFCLILNPVYTMVAVTVAIFSTLAIGPVVL